MKRHLYKHVQQPGSPGFLEDTDITLINKTDPRAPTKREDYWIHNYKTKAPIRHNIEGSY